MTTKTAAIWIAVSSESQTADDKISLAEQEARCRAWCEREGYRVTEVLSIPGHSRYESDIVDALTDFAAKGVFGYHRLRELWKLKTIDVLVCYHDSRLGRSATLYTYALENTIRAGISIYRIIGGWVTASDSSIQNAIGILSATSDIARLMDMRKSAMPKRAERGLNVGPKPVFSHRTVYDDNGRELRVEVDRSKQRLWDDLATLIIEGVAWDNIELELFRRYGHADTNNKPYKNRKFYDLLHTPMFWGHGAWNYRPKGKPNRTKTGIWMFDPTEPPPTGITLYYNAHEAVYTGDQADAVRGELMRRRLVIKGRHNPNRMHEFSGLLICGECGYSMSYLSNNSRSYQGYRCAGRWLVKAYPYRACTQTKSINIKAIREYVGNRLQLALAGNTGDLFTVTPASNADAHVDAIKREIEVLTLEKKRLIRKQATAPEALADDYDEALADIASRLGILENELRRLTSIEQQLEHERIISRKTVAKINDIGLDAFWALPSNEINQLLHAYFGKYRIAVEAGEVAGLAVSTMTTGARGD